MLVGEDLLNSGAVLRVSSLQCQRGDVFLCLTQDQEKALSYSKNAAENGASCIILAANIEINYQDFPDTHILQLDNWQASSILLIQNYFQLRWHQQSSQIEGDISASDQQGGDQQRGDPRGGGLQEGDFLAWGLLRGIDLGDSAFSHKIHIAGNMATADADKANDVADVNKVVGADSVNKASDCKPGKPASDISAGSSAGSFGGQSSYISSRLSGGLWDYLPSNIFAVTGTNGKTSVAFFASSLLGLLGEKAASIGTMGVVVNNGDGHHNHKDAANNPSGNLGGNSSGDFCGDSSSGNAGDSFGDRLGNNPGNQSGDAPNLTTPDLFATHEILYQLKNQGVENVILEASSHGLKQGRIAGLALNSAIFTYLGKDHLDYHGTMQDYKQSKFLLFNRYLHSSSKSVKYAILNADAEEYLELRRDIYNLQPSNMGAMDEPVDGEVGSEVGGGGGITIKTYGRKTTQLASNKQGDELGDKLEDELRDEPEVDFKIIDINLDGTTQGEVVFEYNRRVYIVKTAILGDFQAYNLLAAIMLIFFNYHYTLEDIISAVAKISAPTGRMQIVNHKPLVVIDFAHTPDGLKASLLALNSFRQSNSKGGSDNGGDSEVGDSNGGGGGKLWLLFGCGGDRDKTKRPKMGQVAAEFADRIIITDDNPRWEDARQIRRDVMAGIADLAVVQEIAGRELAIQTALKQMNPQDCLIIAGKGHEEFQLVKGEKHPFSDREVITRAVIKHKRRQKE